MRSRSIDPDRRQDDDDRGWNDHLHGSDLLFGRAHGHEQLLRSLEHDATTAPGSVRWCTG
jgi:hypothetical protein